MLLWVMTRCLLNPVETGSDLVCSGTDGAPERCKCTFIVYLVLCAQGDDHETKIKYLLYEITS